MRCELLGFSFHAPVSPIPAARSGIALFGDGCMLAVHTIVALAQFLHDLAVLIECLSELKAIAQVLVGLQPGVAKLEKMRLDNAVATCIVSLRSTSRSSTRGWWVLTGKIQVLLSQSTLLTYRRYWWDGTSCVRLCLRAGL